MSKYMTISNKFITKIAHSYETLLSESESDKGERKDDIENWSERTYKIGKGSRRERTEN